MDIEDEEAQSNDRVVPEGKDPSSQVDHGDRNPEEAHEGAIQDVGVLVGLGDLGEKPQKVLQRVALLADALIEHGRGCLHSTPDRGALGVLDSNDMVIPEQVAGDYVVRSCIQGATGPSLGGEGMYEIGVLEDGCAGQPGATCQAPRPLVRDPGGASTTAATEEELGTYQMVVSASAGSRDTFSWFGGGVLLEAK